MAASKLWFLWLTIGLGWRLTVVAQESDFERVARENLLRRYRGVLEQHHIESSVSGAYEYLYGLVSEDRVRTQAKIQIERLSSDKYLEREIAESRLTALGPAALELLTAAAKAGDLETQVRAQRAANAIQLEIHPLIETAVAVLKLDSANRHADQPRIALLFKLIKESKDRDLRDKIANCITYCASESSQQQIIEGISNEDRVISTNCIKSLPACLTRSGLADYTYLIESEDPFISLAAIEAFGYVAPTKSIEILVSDHLVSDLVSVRETAAGLLRQLSGTFHQFDANAEPRRRTAAVYRWKGWLKQHRPFSTEYFDRLGAENNPTPTGFLVSDQNRGVRHFDLQSNLLWKRDGRIYDAKFISPNVHLITYRLDDTVVLYRDGEIETKIEDVKLATDAEALEDGKILITQGDGVVVEYSKDGAALNRFEGFLNPFDADRLANGNTLVADSSHNQIVEINQDGQTVWRSENLPYPNNAFRLPDGRTLYTTYQSGIVGMLDVAGNKIWERELPGSVLYSVYAAKHRIYVADGEGGKIWLLDFSGEIIGEFPIGEKFIDVDFVRP